MKRKTDDTHRSNGQHEAKKRTLSDDTVKARFREGLFDPAELDKYTKSYASSGPYKHGVISPLIAPDLLRSVRKEIEQNLSFTEKETDIYKTFQSGDLANLDGLDDASLSRLPSLLQLRDALYSAKFRAYLSSLTGSGELSGKKTDMAITIYTEGCHLLCHDDVIGSRRLSYILYLTDPDTPWRPEWGGALRLYPTKTVRDESTGDEIKIPSPDFSLSIPPAFNQLSFFTVQPGESFHDVEEVYHPSERDKGKEKRVRMAISGWFHIPQEGEEGYEPGLEERLAERSSLSQLQGRVDIYDQPQPQPVDWDVDAVSGSSKGKGTQFDDDGDELTESDLDYLLQFLAPSYLTPDIAEELSETFVNDSSLSLEKVLSEKFAAKVREYIEQQEWEGLPASADDIESRTSWKVARPPHKHRYLFQQPTTTAGAKETDASSPITKLLNEFLPSQPFRKWLTLITGADRLTDYNMLARRFRRGQDYTLASSYEGNEPRLEFTLGLTPSSGWEKVEEDDEKDEDEEEDEGAKNGKISTATTATTKEADTEQPSVGGYEMYMTGEDDEEDDDENDGAEPGRKPKKSDPAIYRAAHDDDDGILFSMAAGWNRMSIVLRDSGTLKFVKYVSAAARGDRWDITGEVGAVFAEEDDDEDDDDHE